MHRKTKWTLLATTILIGTFAATIATADIVAYLTLEVEGGRVEGCSPVHSMDREGTIELSAFGYNLVRPLDLSNQSLEGRRHSPLMVRTNAGCPSTVFMYKALTEEQSVTEAVIRFYRPSPGGEGQEENYYTVELRNGYISAITSAVSSEPTEAEQGQYEILVSFIFQQITWTFEDGGVSHTDNW